MRLNKTVIILTCILVLILGVFVPPMISMGRFRKQIQTSISSAVGRNVAIGETNLRLLPKPGIDLTNIVIAEDPAFGGEPIIRAEEVTAFIRLSSLWRGRIEIAKLSLKYPSMNLVRSADGHWNVESLVQRTSQSSSAPTSQAHGEARPRFPYIESDTGRINFKIDNEKKVFSLTEADFALWQESENEWRVRLAARPVRTDLSLSDTGVFKLQARFQRAKELRSTPLELRVNWERAQLGQLTSLIYGRDRGWRGNLELSTVLTGTPEALTVTSDARIDDFRRYDIFTAENFRIVAHCSGKFSSTNEQFSDVDCQLPMQRDGIIHVRGSGGADTYDLGIAARNVPAQTVVLFARHTKRDIPEDLAATGAIDGAFTLRKSAANVPAVWEGGGQTSGVVLRSSVLEAPLTLGNLKFGFPTVSAPAQASRRGNATRKAVSQVAATEPRLNFAPFSVSLGQTGSPISTGAWFSPTGYNISAQGEGEITRLLQIGRALGLRVPKDSLEGRARFDIAIAGQWAGLGYPRPTGLAQIRDIRTEFPGAAAPLRIASADLRLEEDAARLENISASFTGVPMNFTGMVEVPRGCEKIEDCPILFDLSADQVSAETLNRLLNPRAHKQPWYRILTPSTNSNPLLARINARGRLSAKRLVLGAFVANKVTGQAELLNGVLLFPEVQGELFGGLHSGQWKLDFSGEQPRYEGGGTVSNVALAHVSTAMRDKWASGTSDVAYRASLAGSTADEVLSSADASFKFSWRGGELRHVTLTNGASLRFQVFTGDATFRKGVLSFAPSKMQTQRGILDVSGTVSSTRKLDLQLRDGERSFSVSGTVEQPKIEQAKAAFAGE